MKLSGMAGRIVKAILVGVVTFIVVFIIGAIVAHFDGEIGGMIEKFSPLLGLLAGLVMFFTGESPIV